MVPVSEVADPANDYNLNIPRYVDVSEPEDLHDLDAHLHGGIPDRDLDALSPWWEVFPSLRATFFESTGRDGYSRMRIDKSDLDAAVRDHPDCQHYRQQIGEVFDLWRDAHAPFLRNLDHDDVPARVIHALSESLLDCFRDLPLISSYDVYQRLMDYWDAVMQDDVHLVVSDGWLEAAKPRATIEDRHRRIKEAPDLTVQRRRYKMDLVPPRLIAARWFAAEQAEVDALQAAHDAAARELEAFIEEHVATGDGDAGGLAATVNDKGRITKAGVTARLLDVETDPESHEEQERLLCCLAVMDAETATGRTVKVARGSLDAHVLVRYDMLTQEDINEIVVDDKWFASIHDAVDEQVDQVVRRLATRAQELEKRYRECLFDLERLTVDYATRVHDHLTRMGLSI